MVEIFKNANYNFLGKRWLFIGFSLLFLLAGAISIAWRVADGDPSTRAFNLGIDFTGGTLVNVKFKEPPDLGRLRSVIEGQGVESSKITLQPISEQVGQAPKNEVFIRLPTMPSVMREAGQSETADETDIGKLKILAALKELNNPSERDKTDLNLIGRNALKEKLAELNPLNLRAGDAEESERVYGGVSARIVDYRERERGGIFGSVAEIQNLGGIESQIMAALEEHFFTGVAAVRSAEAVSPQIGADLRNRAVYVTLAACAGMLVYVAVRFKSWGYGLGAVVAVFHDVLVTLGVFSIMRWEVDLNLVGALLSLIGFSMNDTIVIFDRVREKRVLKRREGLEELTNRSINETLSRTALTNGTAFLCASSLVLFGGEVLRSFSWALLIGVLVGTYSTLYIASPFMLWWEGRKARGRASSEAETVASAAPDNSEAPAVKALNNEAITGTENKRKGA